MSDIPDHFGTPILLKALTIRADEGIDINQLLGQLKHEINLSEHDQRHAQLEDSQVLDWEITDSK